MKTEAVEETDVKERPILFSGPMVRAILAGRKRQTRRIVKPSNSKFGSTPVAYWDHADFDAPHPGTLIDGRAEGSGQYLHVPCHFQPDNHYTLAKQVDCDHCREWGWECTRHRLYCRWEPGERLWVRETWSPIPAVKPSGYFTDPKWQDRRAWYAADNDKPTWGGKWRPSIHMPRWASRITLRITGVRVERLQEISEEDAIAEGIHRFATDPPMFGASPDGTLGPMVGASAVEAFAYLWESINGKGSWDANPWVWCLSFKRV